ncbi:nicotinate-nucleotide pyrophosphorylase [carboxylating] [Planctomycetales bacterium]|nr:nicotinate-nucleotide pyrophosphorylase [carboxylating] [Planctomycetales bacterium]GHS99953.1 nicotinate-nucleotide pyrophosphorylase [carboxylating] [Planctomycetales bacterium]
MLSSVQWQQVDALLALALAEDVGDGDVTTAILAPAAARLSAAFVARRAGVLSGGEIVRRFFAFLDPEVTVTPLVADGEPITAGQPLLKIAGAARSILTGERVSLNFLQRMSGVATVTRRYVEAVRGTGAKIYDTRKTLPGHRALDKLAVAHGGGANHRLGLFDMILIKDNHLALAGIASPAEAVRRARSRSALPLMVEVDTLEQLRAVLPSAPDYILLDNMDAPTMREAVALTAAAFPAENSRPQLEASGGITLDNIRAVAETGVNRISVGALTHSVAALDLGLDAIAP